MGVLPLQGMGHKGTKCHQNGKQIPPRVILCTAMHRQVPCSSEFQLSPKSPSFTVPHPSVTNIHVRSAFPGACQLYDLLRAPWGLSSGPCPQQEVQAGLVASHTTESFQGKIKFPKCLLCTLKLVLDNTFKS